MCELVGERIRSIFSARSISIGLLDERNDEIRWAYELEEGNRFQSAPMAIGTGLTSTVLASGSPLRRGTSVDLMEAGAIDLGGLVTESWLGVPIRSGDRNIGILILESTQQHAFSEADERLLTTIASSMGVALENARLFDETKRLLTETDERAAELAIINDVQQGLAAQIEMQAMYDLVGERLREIFDAQVLDIGIYDRETGLIHFPYTIERGVRFPDEPIPLMGIRQHVIEIPRAAADQRALDRAGDRVRAGRRRSRARPRSRPPGRRCSSAARRRA